MLSLRAMLTRALIVLTAAATGVPAYSAAMTGCTVVSAPRGDENPGPLVAAGYDPRDLDLIGFQFHGDLRHLIVRTRTAHLTRNPTPPGYRLTFETFWSTQGEGGDRSFDLTAEFDGASSVFTLGVTAAGAPETPNGAGKTYTQVGGPLQGTVNYRTAEVAIDIPYQLISRFASGRAGMTLYRLAVASYWGFGNPSVTAGGRVLVGSSGYNRIADSALAQDPFRITQSGRCTH